MLRQWKISPSYDVLGVVIGWKVTRAGTYTMSLITCGSPSPPCPHCSSVSKTSRHSIVIFKRFLREMESTSLGCRGAFSIRVIHVDGLVNLHGFVQGKLVPGQHLFTFVAAVLVSLFDRRLRNLFMRFAHCVYQFWEQLCQEWPENRKTRADDTGGHLDTRPDRNRDCIICSNVSDSTVLKLMGTYVIHRPL
jgi:hypothetical protein